MRTKETFVWARGCSALPREQALVIVAAGAPVQYNKANKAYYVVPSFFKADAIVMHDATYYGCRVELENVVLE